MVRAHDLQGPVHTCRHAGVGPVFLAFDAVADFGRKDEFSAPPSQVSPDAFLGKAVAPGGVHERDTGVQHAIEEGAAFPFSEVGPADVAGAETQEAHSDPCRAVGS